MRAPLTWAPYLPVARGVIRTALRRDGLEAQVSHTNVQEVPATVVQSILAVPCGGQGSQGGKKSEVEKGDLDHDDGDV